MKSLTKALIIILAITTLIPVLIGTYCLFVPESALELFQITSLSDDLLKVLPTLGGFMWATIALPILAITWLVKKKQEGYTVAYLTGFVALGRGLLTIISAESPEISKLTITPLAIGVVTLLFTFLASRQSHSQR